MGRPEAVFFDFGDTLWHFPHNPSTEEILSESVQRIGRAFDSEGSLPSDLVRQVARDLPAAVSAAELAADCGDLRSPDYIDITQRVSASTGMKLDRERAAKLWLAWNVGGQFLGRCIYTGTFETLDWLKNRGYRIGAITNRALGGQAFLDELRQHWLYDYFEVISISADVGWRKPHPAIFEHALAAMNVAAEQCIMVGDHPVADVEGARALGMTAIWKRNSFAVFTGNVQPDFVIDQPRQLIELPIFKRS